MTPTYEACERCPASGAFWPGIARGCYRGSRVQSAGLSAHLVWSRRQHWYDAVDAFIAPSAFLKDKFVTYGFSRDKIRIQGHFLPALPAHTPENPDPYFLYLGRLSEEKGVRWLLKTFQENQTQGTLVVAGNGPLLSEVQASVSARIRYAGFVNGDEKASLLKKASAVILASECYENFPLVITEANGYGVPMLVADHGGMAEWITPGENGERFRPGDVASFGSAAARLLEPTGQMERRQRTHLWAARHFAKSQFIENRLALYRELTKERTGGYNTVEPSKKT